VRNQLFVQLCRADYDLKKFLTKKEGVGTSWELNPEGAFYVPGDPSFGDTTNHVSHSFSTF
jgi:hypothetical protein